MEKKSAILFHKTVNEPNAVIKVSWAAMSSVSGYEIGGLAGAVEEIIIIVVDSSGCRALVFTSFRCVNGILCNRGTRTRTDEALAGENSLMVTAFVTDAVYSASNAGMLKLCHLRGSRVTDMFSSRLNVISLF